jgi:uncharacterized membrane protein
MIKEMSDSILEYLPKRHQPENINTRHRQELNLQDRMALFATKFIGTMYAVYLTCFFFLIWVIWQSLLTENPIDPYPFAFLLFLASIAQLPLMSLIMVGQNLQGKHAELRAEEEYKTTQSISKDIEKILFHLDKQDKEIGKQSELIQKLQNQCTCQKK